MFSSRVAIVVILIFSVLLLVLFVGKNSSKVLTGKVKEIVLTNSGFDPQIVTIAQGDTVVFSSNTGKHFWPASNIHPYHSIYPEFDPRRPLSPEEQWIFTFNKPGQWLFHDHLSSQFTGAIIVAPSPGTSLGECDETEPNAQECWNISITQTFWENGLDAAFDEMSRIHDLNPTFASACHNFTHDIGLLAFSRYGDDVPITEKTSYCNDGFYHGYMEGFLTEYQDPHVAREFCDEVEETIGDIYSLAFHQCNHGIGHGTTEYLLHTRSDLWGHPIEIIKIGIDFCDATNDTEEDKFRCASGAYSVLGDWMLLQENYEQKFLPLDERGFWICEEAQNEWAVDGCIWELSKRIVRRMQEDETEALHVVENAGRYVRGGAYTSRAVRSVADGIGQKSVANKDSNPFSICSIFEEKELLNACLVGISDGLYHAGPPGREAEYTANKCLSSGLNTDQKLMCANNLIERIRLSAHSEKIVDICQLFSDIEFGKETCSR